jgi:hypothetical protein
MEFDSIKAKKDKPPTRSIIAIPDQEVDFAGAMRRV